VIARTHRILALAALLACVGVSAAPAQSPTPHATPTRPSATRLDGVMTPGARNASAQSAHPPQNQSPSAAQSSPIDMDARRAAAARLLVASRFRERQAVTIEEGLRTTELEMAGECLQRAIDGRNMQTCRAIANPSDAMRARLSASVSSILDEVIAASQSVYARRFTVTDMDEITRFFRTPVGQRYGELYPQIISDVQLRKRAILRRYLTKAAADTADQKAS
jgi:hypothetical protein